MSRRSKQKKKGMNPATAAVLFLVSAGVAARQLFPGSVDQGFAVLGNALADDADPDAQSESDLEATGAGNGIDLLARHGTFDRAQTVRVAFATVTDLPVAAPAGESRPQKLAKWEGKDPPLLSLGVVMISDSARRAVLDGRVVGIDDEIGGGIVTAIERGKVVLSWQGKVLTYDLQDPAPIEFRPERDRRELAKPAAERTNPTSNPEVVK